GAYSAKFVIQRENTSRSTQRQHHSGISQSKSLREKQLCSRCGLPNNPHRNPRGVSQEHRDGCASAHEREVHVDKDGHADHPHEDETKSSHTNKTQLRYVSFRHHGYYKC